LVTRDPARQPRAASLMMWMLAASRSAAWTQAMGLLPVRASALDRWEEIDPYVLFLRQELNRAVAPPPFSVITAVGPVFRTALADVLAGKSAPEAAAATAVAQLEGATP
jgi:ABC-type glycerol-3-phosphate transport system substrate-binding protein